MERIDCDVFMKEGTTLDIDKVIFITGNFYAGKDCYIATAIIADENIILEDYADTVGICAGKNVSVGKFSKTLGIYADGSIFLDDYATANDVFSKEDVILGYEACALSINNGGEIIVENYLSPKTFFSKLIQDIKWFFFGD